MKIDVLEKPTFSFMEVTSSVLPSMSATKKDSLILMTKIRQM